MERRCGMGIISRIMAREEKCFLLVPKNQSDGPLFETR
jgi:hypothetical protein